MLSIDWLNPMFYERTMHTVFYILLVDKHIITMRHNTAERSIKLLESISVI